MAEVLIAYLDFAEQHYRDQEGNPTDEVRHLKVTIRHVRELYGEAPATEFGPLALKAVRQKFVEQKWCRKTVNARVERIRRIFKWAVAEEMLPPSVHQALAAVSGLQRGRTRARESEPVGPVDDAVVDATIAHLNRHVRGLVEFQRLTGCRPGEACRIRRCDIDTGGGVWLYKPAYHKTAWKGKSRRFRRGGWRSRYGSTTSDEPAMPPPHPTPTPCPWFSRLASTLDPRSGPRLVRLFLGAVLARARRTVTSWIRAAGLIAE